MKPLSTQPGDASCHPRTCGCIKCEPETDEPTPFANWYCVHGIPLGIGRGNAKVIYEAAIAEYEKAERMPYYKQTVTMPVWTEDDLIATRFQFGSEFQSCSLNAVSFDRTVSPFYKGEKWAVRKGSFCLSKNGAWEHEPIPSSRDDEFYSRCRFDSLQSAISVFGV